VKQKVGIKDKKTRTQINGRFTDISSADENIKNIIVEPLFKNYKTTIHLFVCRTKECGSEESVKFCLDR
jgi:hypothetical protein